MENTPEETSVALTGTQHEICDALRNHALLHYGFLGDLGGEAGLKPRCYPLLAGPTGAGKSMLVERVAQQLGAEYFRVTYGEWMPHGVREPAVPTMVRLARLLVQCPRVVVHVDELDKWISGSHEWGRSLSTDLWNLLDAKIPWEQARAMNPSAKEVLAGGATNGVEEESLTEFCVPTNFTRTEHMWIVGSGTWQDIFDRRAARAIGFRSGGASSGRNEAKEIAQAIRASKVIPTELTARFATDLLVLTYPTAEETAEILEDTGLNALAAELGLMIGPNDVDYAAAGMRALESLKTKLLLAKIRQVLGWIPDEAAEEIASDEAGLSP